MSINLSQVYIECQVRVPGIFALAKNPICIVPSQLACPESIWQLLFFPVLQMILGVCLLLWSACTTCTGFVSSYWQLLLLRIGVAVG